MSTQSSFVPDVRDRPAQGKRNKAKPWTVECFWIKPWLDKQRGWRPWRRYEQEDVAKEAALRFAHRYGDLLRFRVVKS